MCKVAIRKWRNIQEKPIVKGALDSHAFVCFGWNSLSGYSQVSSKIDCYECFPVENSARHSGWSKAHLAISTEQVPNKGCLCKSISIFTMGLYSSPYDYIIHVALIATSHVSLITILLCHYHISLLQGCSHIRTYCSPLDTARWALDRLL